MKFAVNNKTKTKYFPLWVPFQHGANGNVDELWVVCKDSFCISYRENCELDIIFTEMTDGETISGKDLAVSFEFQELLAAVATENREDPLAEMLTQYIKLDFPENGISKEIDGAEIDRRKQLFVEWFDQMASQLSEGECRYFFDGISEPFGSKSILSAAQQFQTTRFLEGTAYVYSGICKQNADGGMSFVSLSELIEGQCQETELVENSDGNTLAKNLEIFCDYYADNKVHYIGIGKKRYGRRGNVSVCRYIGRGEMVVKIPPTYSGAPVFRIEEDAFRECDMEEVFLPYGVEVVGARAFEDCLNLKKIHLPMGIKQMDIETIPMGCILVTVEESAYIKELCFGGQNIHKIGYELEDGTPIREEEKVESLLSELPPIEESTTFSNDLSALSEEISDLLEEVELALDKNDKKQQTEAEAIEGMEEIAMPEEEVVQEAEEVVEEIAMPEEEVFQTAEEVVEEIAMPEEEVFQTAEEVVEEMAMPEEEVFQAEEVVEEIAMPEEEIVEEIAVPEEEVEEEVLQAEAIEVMDEIVTSEVDVASENLQHENIQDEMAVLQGKLAELEAILEARGLNNSENKDKIAIEIPEEKITIDLSDVSEEVVEVVEEVVEEIELESNVEISEEIEASETTEEIELSESVAAIEEELDMSDSRVIYDNSPVESLESVILEQKAEEFVIPDIMPELFTDVFSEGVSEKEVVESSAMDEDSKIEEVLSSMEVNILNENIDSVEEVTVVEEELSSIEEEELPSMEEMLARLNEEMDELSVKELTKPDLIIEDIVSLGTIEEMTAESETDNEVSQKLPELRIEEIVPEVLEETEEQSEELEKVATEQLELMIIEEEGAEELEENIEEASLEKVEEVVEEPEELTEEAISEEIEEVVEESEELTEEAMSDEPEEIILEEPEEFIEEAISEEPEEITVEESEELIEEAISEEPEEIAIEEPEQFTEEVISEEHEEIAIEEPEELIEEAILEEIEEIAVEEPEELIEEVISEEIEEIAIEEPEELTEEEILDSIEGVIPDPLISTSKTSPLKLTIGEKGNSFIALNLPVDMLNQIGILLEDETTYPIMLLGNYIDCAIEEQIIKYNLLTKEMTKKTVDENVVSLLNRSVSRNAKANEAFKNTCADFTTIMNAVLLGEYEVLNNMLSKWESTLEIVEEDGVLRVKDSEGEIHSMQEVLWIISQNC